MRGLRCGVSKQVAGPALKILLFGIVALALFYGEERWRANRAWEDYLSHSGLTQGQIDLKTYLPKPVPDDENFAATPVVKGWFAEKSQTTPFSSDHFSKAPPSLIQTIKNVERKHGRQPLDLDAWQRGLMKMSDSGVSSKDSPLSRKESAAAVIASLQDDDDAIESLRGAVTRSKFSYPVNYLLDDPWNTLLPHLAHIKELSLRLELRSCAELAVGDGNKAFDDVMLTFFLAHSLTNESFIVSHLIRANCVHAAVQPIWEGITEHQWSDLQLQQMEKQLLHFNLVRELDNPLKSERAVGIVTIDSTQRKGVNYLARTISTNRTVFGGVVGRGIDWVIPAGWFTFEKANYCRAFDLLFTDSYNPGTGIVSSLQADANIEAFNTYTQSGSATGVILHHKTAARLFLPTLPKALFRTAMAQTAANQAAIACALERYHLANGRYPTTLESLLPDWISVTPHDVIGGQGYRYRLIDKDQFILYSVGWDEEDNDGNPGESLFGHKGDWLW